MDIASGKFDVEYPGVRAGSSEFVNVVNFAKQKLFDEKDENEKLSLRNDVLLDASKYDDKKSIINLFQKFITCH